MRITDFSSFLLLRASSYRCIKPFSDVFGVTSRLVLTQQLSLDELAALPVEELASQLYELGGHHLPDPHDNARKLQQVAQESFSLDETLTLPVQRILDLTLEHIHFLETQVEQVDGWIATELESYPVIAQLATIPGIGPVFSSGIGAEIGGIQRFLQGQKWDRKRKRYRSRNLRDAEDAVAKIAGLWWPRSSSGDLGYLLSPGLCLGRRKSLGSYRPLTLPRNVRENEPKQRLFRQSPESTSNSTRCEDRTENDRYRPASSV